MSKLPQCPRPMLALGRFMLVLSVAMVGCESPSVTEVDVASFAKGALKSSATGSGQFLHPIGGALRSFGFSALETGGEVTGAFAAHNQRNGRSGHGLVTCFTIGGGGNEAWIGGTLKGFLPGLPNITVDVGFRVEDNGRASRNSPTPDRISFLRGVAAFELADAAAFCIAQPTVATSGIAFFGTLPVVAGDIQVLNDRPGRRP